MGLERADLAAVYERYLTRCNEHRFDQLGEFVSEQVSGSGPVDGLAGYIDGVKAVCTAFPDYRWELQELVVEEDTIAARLIGQGTHTGPFSGIAPPAGRSAPRSWSSTESPTARSSSAGETSFPWSATP